MAEGSKPAQDGRNQPAHQGTVPIGQHLQAGVGTGAVELVVKRALLWRTPSRISAAIRRAARPGTSVGRANRCVDMLERYSEKGD
jgi:hypothetical protein